jgi:rhodanese-related sulfurtransferase
MMKSLHSIALFVAVGLCAVAALLLWRHVRDNPTPEASAAVPPREYKTINVDEARRWLSPLTRKGNLSVIDVRTPEEFARGGLPNAVNVDYLSADFVQRINRFDKLKSYLVYCRSQNRSPKAAKLMLENGFYDVYVLEGGWLKWRLAEEQAPPP